MKRSVLVAGAAVVVVAAIAAVLVSQGQGPDQVDLSAIPAPVVTGKAIPPYDPTAATDPAAGETVPGATGTDFALNPVQIVPDGRPKVVLFLAHWCTHCQTEVPKVQEWLDRGGQPSGVDFYSVATSIDDLRPNYPPDAWLEREGWTPAVLVDVDGSVARAFGLTAFPYWVFIDSQGRLLGRAAAEVPQDSLTDLFLLVS